MNRELREKLLESHLEILFQVSRVLSRSLQLRQTLQEVVDLLHDVGGYHYGFITLADEETNLQQIYSAHRGIRVPLSEISYDQGEGVVGAIIESGETVLLPCVGDEPAFLDKLKVFNRELPFIGAPIVGNEGVPIGVLAVQPEAERSVLGERARFVEMVANLISQTVRLFKEIESEKREIADERDVLRRRVKNQHGFDKIVGRTPAMRQIFEQVRLVSKWNTTVLIRGESGTGKELIANAIHYNSPRNSAPFIKLNCAAVPENLLESEIFGHEKGSFTGATGLRKGRFELADGGTLFLDEIGEISGAFQAKLLRVLQEGEFERVGGSKTFKVDVRVIAATNRDLEGGVERGEFREDLYYRLNVMPIQMPPLRERSEDVPDLTNFLISKIGNLQGRKLSVTDSAVRMLARHSWPGNVRELENFLERAAIMCESGAIDCDVIELAGLREKNLASAPQPAPVSVSVQRPSMPASEGSHVPTSANPGADVAAEKVDFNDPQLSERERVVAALEKAGWVQAKAARLLNMTPRQIAYRIQTLDIKVHQI